MLQNWWTETAVRVVVLRGTFEPIPTMLREIQHGARSGRQQTRCYTDFTKGSGVQLARLLSDLTSPSAVPGMVAALNSSNR